MNYLNKPGRKKTLKKVTTLILSLSLMVASFAGCSKTNDQKAEEPTGTPAKTAETKDEASKFPEREITLVVPYDAGGASDMTSRIIATGLKKELNGTVLVVNKSGGTGSVGMAYARSQKADGYTLCYIPVEIVMQKALNISDIVPEDFTIIGQLTEVPSALTVAADAPYNTVQEFVEYAKKNPGKVTIGNSGTGSIWHIAATKLEEASGAKFNHIPYDGAAGAVTSLMGGHIDAVTVNTGEVLAGVQSKKLKILALMTEERDPSFPDVPTMKESGFDFAIGGWGALAVPAKTPQAVVDKLSKALEGATASTEFSDFIKERGMIVHYRNSADATKFVKEQETFFTDMLSNMKLD